MIENILEKIPTLILHVIEIFFLLELYMLYFTTADLISTVEFNHNGDLLATGDKGGRIVIFQKDEAVSCAVVFTCSLHAVYNFCPDDELQACLKTQNK